jgi:shikimate kinase
MPKHIILTGMRGSGKSHTGKILAKTLKLPFLDLDEEIVLIAKQKIPEIVKNYGWSKFREIEHKACKALTKLKEPMVIALGGGTITFSNNQEILKYLGTIIYIKIDGKTSYQRTKNDKNRPNLTEKNAIEEANHIFEERDPIYQKYSDLKINSSISAEEDAEQIIYLLKSQKLFSNQETNSSN